MELETFEHKDYDQLTAWIDSEKLCYLWGGPAYKYPLTHEQIEIHCKQLQVFPFLFTVENNPVGFVELYQVSVNEFRICRVFISPEYRGQNLAQTMLQLLIEKAQVNYKANLLTLGVFSHNKSAISCYEKLGFVEFEQVTNSLSFDGESWDLSRMEKRL
ncbi:GNAT family N-acetyltransferase [Aliivibrio logei]|uniref:GCN5 family acetyltransferase n=1 Tax=Aliivibrio logei TaxID=688 RepID=A0A1B9NT66_ALILO|nr:GNAT family N-acetyltransferase [Aliivibrio logei]OCH16172.1 GCN5 family acetyltransferase [Aliivibrio logei]